MRYLVTLLITSSVFAQPVLRFKVATPVTQNDSPTLATRIAGDAGTAARNTATTTGTGHIIVQFADAPTAATIAALKSRGATVLGDVPDNALLISTTFSVDLTGLDAILAMPLDPAVKISPVIDRNATAGADYLVEFHADVDLNRGRSMILNIGTNGGVELRENPDLGPGRLMIRVRARARGADPLDRLASLDEVAYIFPASQDLSNGAPTMALAGPVSESGTVGQYIATVGDGWDGPGRGTAKIGYYFSAASTRLSADVAKGEILRAMQEWSKVAAITWTPGTSATAAKTVNVLFGRQAHGDAYPFDGAGNVLAHTFYPSAPNPEPLAGDMHIDDDENWHVGGVNTDLFSVALHELGHALGLGHSDNPNDVMYPYYKIVTTLAAGDKTAVLSLYAAASTTTVTTPTIPTTPTTTTPTTTTPTTTTPTTPTVTPTTPSSTPTTPTTTPASTDRTAPSLTITSSSATSITVTTATKVFTGTASDAGGLARITWETNAGATGTATGTTSWTATIPLITGINQVTIKAIDKAGNVTWRTVVVTRK